MEIKYSSRFVEHILIFLSVTFFSQAVLSLISDILEYTDAADITIFTYLFSAVISFVFFIIYENYFSSKSKASNQIRFICLFYILLFVLCWFLREYIFVPLILGITFIIFIFYSSIFEVVYYHDDLEEECEGKSGEKLGNDLIHNKFLGEDFLKSLNSKNTVFIVISGIFLLFLCAMSFTVVKLSKFTYISAFFYFFSIFLLLYLFSMYKKEIFYAFAGFEKQWNYRSKTILFSFSFLMISLFAGFVFSSNTAHINLKFLFQQKEIQQTTETKQETSPVLDFEFSPDFEAGKLEPGNYKPIPKFLEILLLIIEILLIVGVILGILIFIFRPFINKQFNNHLKEHRLKKFFKNFFDNFKAMLKHLFTFRFKKAHYSTIDEAVFKNTINDFIRKSKKSKEKKAELDRLTSQFIKLIDWGTIHEVAYKKNLAPAEYTNMLNDYFKLHNLDKYIPLARETGLLFEKSLYSKDLLTAEEENQYSNNIKTIINQD